MSTTNTPETDDIDAGMARLEAALERIATAPRKIVVVPAPIEATESSAIVAERLDKMIARLRAAIDEA
jgi:hypothetical protein